MNIFLRIGRGRRPRRPVVMTLVTFSAPSMRGLSPRGDWRSFCRGAKLLPPLTRSPSLTEEGKKVHDAGRRRRRPLPGKCVKRPKIKRAQPSLRAFGLLQINRPYPLPLSSMFALCRGRFSCVQNLWALPKPYFNTASEAPKDKKSAAFAALFRSAANKSPVLTRRGHARAISPRCPLPHTVPFSPPA